MRFRFLTVVLFLLPNFAHAQQAGEPCPKFGKTIVSDDKKSVLACLRPTLGDPESPLLWQVVPGAPEAWQLDDNSDREPFYTIGPEHKAGE